MSGVESASLTSGPARDWAPFALCADGERSDPPRSIHTLEGVGDRLRAAAFAEIQAREAFLWAAERFADAPDALRDAWRALAREEDKHLGWLLRRLEGLGLEVTARKVSTHLWISLTSCQTAQEFAVYMANAEERGRRAGERFWRDLESKDPVTAGIFGQIAKEEVAHIELARTFFGATPSVGDSVQPRSELTQIGSMGVQNPTA